MAMITVGMDGRCVTRGRFETAEKVEKHGSNESQALAYCNIFILTSEALMIMHYCTLIGSKCSLLEDIFSGLGRFS